MIDPQIRHAIFIQRYADGVWSDLQPILEHMNRDIVKRLGQEPTVFQAGRMNELVADIKGLTDKYTKQWGGELINRTNDFAEYEVDFQAKALQKAASVEVAVPSPAQLAASVTNAPMTLMGEDHTISSMVSQFGEAKGRQLETIMRAGYIEGMTTQKIVSRIRGAQKDLTRRDAAAVVRTTVNHLSAQSHKLVEDENSDILKGSQWSSTLDLRTTPICQERDGTLYKVGEGPWPPAHWNCRSRRISVIKDKYRLPGVGGQRASKDGPVDANLTYPEWLAKQPHKVQDEVLGKTRAKLVRDGKLDVKKFTDDTGKRYTLQELRRMNDLTLDDIKPPRVKPKRKPKTFKERIADDNVAAKWHKKSWDESPKWLQDHIVAKQNKLETLTHNTVEKNTINGRMERVGAYYSRFDRKINMGSRTTDTIGGRSTWRHEYGHHLDHEAGDGMTYRSTSADFTNAMAREAGDASKKFGYIRGGSPTKAMTKSIAASEAATARVVRSQNRLAELNLMAEEAGIDFDDFNRWANKNTWGGVHGSNDLVKDSLKANALDALRRRDPRALLDALDGRIRDSTTGWQTFSNQGAYDVGVPASFSDLMDAATNGKVTGSGAHSKSYYKGSHDRRQTEAWANMVDLIGSGPAGERIVEIMFPRMYKIMKDAMT